MSIKYKLIYRGDSLNPEGFKKTGYYPQVVRAKTVKLDDLALSIARDKRKQAVEVKGTLQLLIACIEDELLAGNNVCLDGFGTFSLSVQGKRTVTNPKEIRAESIEVKRVTFKTSTPLKCRLKDAKFVRSQD